MLLNNWHVTYEALLKSFAASISSGKYFFTASTSGARTIARLVVFLWTMSYFVVMVVVILNILINWFFEIYSKHFEQEDKNDKERSLIAEEHKNDHYREKEDERRRRD